MNIQAEKLELVRLILDTNNPNILNSIRGLFTKSKTIDFWETLSSEQKNDIQEGIDEIENGETVDYNDFIKEYR
jgi:hypothetical protein